MNFEEQLIYWEEPTTEEYLAALSEVVKLPDEHLQFLQKSDGVEACLKVPPYQVHIWSVDEFLILAPVYDDLINEVMEMPSMLAFGDNRNRQVFLYDRSVHPWKVVCCPRISLCRELVIDVAPDFNSLVSMLGTRPPA